MEVTNIVGSGELGIEIEQQGLIEYLEENTSESQTVEADSGATSGVEFWFDEELPRATIHTSGSYIIRASTEEELFKADAEFCETMQELGIIESDDTGFEVVNVVATHEMELENQLNLMGLTMELGIPAEYEPEVFPAINYDVDDADCTVLIYTNGKLVVSGASSIGDVMVGINTVRKTVGMQPI